MKKGLLVLVVVVFLFILCGCDPGSTLTTKEGKDINFNSFIMGWGCLALIVSALAQALKRDGFGWFLFAIFTGPFALFILTISGRNDG